MGKIKQIFHKNKNTEFYDETEEKMKFRAKD